MPLEQSLFMSDPAGSDRMAPIIFAGRACRLPGANSVAEFASLLRDGRCAVSEIPEDRWRHAPFLHPVPGVRGKTYTFAAGVIENADAFDPAPFGLTPREADYMDPQQRLLLQVVWEAIEDAGLPPSRLAGPRTGVFVGASMMDHGASLMTDPAISDGYMMTGNALAVIANRISHVFGFTGPSMTIDTACSSALFALDSAMRALREGRIDTAIVGATNLLMTPSYFVGFAEARMLSPSGLCQSFSSAADGYVRAEGAVAFVLRRAEGAADGISCDLHGDHGRLIHVGTNTGGSPTHIALPCARAQSELLRKTYSEAGVDPDELAFVEAHGTGTPAGDPVEAQALGAALGSVRSAPLAIGSVKTNIGHLEPAAGAAGLLKALLALESSQLPASLHFGSENPDIAFADLNLRVAARPLPLNGCLAGVSAFGFGGANAHAIVAARRGADRAAIDPPPPASSSAVPVLLLSAVGGEALAAQAARYRDCVWDGDARNDRLLAALVHRRDRHPNRLAILASDRATTRAALDAAATGGRHPALVRTKSGLVGQPVAFLFSGNGAQHPAMSLAARANAADYRAEYERLDGLWQEVAGWSLAERLADPDLPTRLRQADTAQPLLFADQVAMARAMIARGAAPTAVLGHSGGELAAAAVAGCLADRTALAILHARSRAQVALTGAGAMAAIQAPAAEVMEALAKRPELGVTIAAVNSPESVTVAGPAEGVGRFRRDVRRLLRRAAVPLKVDYAFHHAMQDEMEDDFRARLPQIEPSAGRVAVYSSVAGGAVDPLTLDADHWWANIRQPVHFADAVAAMQAEGHRLFVEIGPDPVLGAYVRDTLASGQPAGAITHSASRSDPVWLDPIAMAIARLAAEGAAFDKVIAPAVPRGSVPDLQTYPWQNRSFRADAPSERIARTAGRGRDWHPLLGRAVETDIPIWQREVDAALAGDLADHRLAGKAVLPGTAMMEMALAAGRRALNAERIDIRDLDLLAPVVLGTSRISELRTTVLSTEGVVRIESRARFSSDRWQLHARGTIVAMPQGNTEVASASAPDFTVTTTDPSRPEAAPAGAEERPGAWLYLLTKQAGLDYGPAFQRIDRYRICGPERVEMVLGSPSHIDKLRDESIDCIGFDAALHGIAGLLEGGRYARDALSFVPVRLGRLLVTQPGTAIRTARLTITRRGERSLLADLDCYDAAGRLAVMVRDLRLGAVRLEKHPDLMRQAWHLTALPIPSAEQPAPSSDDAPRSIADRLAEPMPEPSEPELLLDAAANLIAGEALRNAQSPIPAAAETFLTVCRQIAGAEPCVGDAAEEELADLPSIQAVLAAAVSEDAELGAECVALARLSEAMPDLLAGGLDLAPDALLGRGAIGNLARGAAWRAARDHAVAAIQGETGLTPELSLSVPSGEPRLSVPSQESASHRGAEPPVEVIVPSPFAAVRSSDGETPGSAVFVAGRDRAHVSLLRAAMGLAETAASPPASGGNDDIAEVPDHVVEALLSCQETVSDQHDADAAPADAPSLDAGRENATHTDLAVERGCPSVSILEFLAADDDAIVDRLLGISDIFRDMRPGATVIAVIPGGSGCAHWPEEPGQAALWAAFRTVRNEYPEVRVICVDPEPGMGRAALRCHLSSALAAGRDESELLISAAGCAALRVTTGLGKVASGRPDEASALTVDATGGLETLGWTAAPHAAPGVGEVQVRVTATGLNYRDVLWAMGALPEEACERGAIGPRMGMECCGQIVAHGEGVDAPPVGAEVIVLGGGLFGSCVNVPASLVRPSPVAGPAAAALPVAYVTAELALVDVAGTASGETVLVHGGAGGVGLAAIEIAKAAGARVIATAGTEAKRSFLRLWGADEVFASRDGAFEEGVRDVAPDGVDVVLNSLSGRAMERTMGLIAPFGRFVEIGKQDLYANGRVGLRALRDNVTWQSLDLDRMLAARPALLSATLDRVLSRLADGSYRALPYRIYDPEDVTAAFRTMQRSDHVGRLIVRAAADRPGRPMRGQPVFDQSDGWLVIAGGGGGVGLELVRGQVARGARRIAVLGRAPAPSEDLAALADLAAGRGSTIRYLACDIADASRLDDALNRLRAEAPVTTVVHSAMELHDEPLSAVTRPVLEAALAAKVSGLANLDRATSRDPVGTFVAFSSIATLAGTHGQAAYVAANGYVEALIRRRRARKMPGLAIGWAAIGDAGYLARNPDRARLIRRMGGADLSIRQVLRVFDLLLARDQRITDEPVVWIGPFDWAAARLGLPALDLPFYNGLAERRDDDGLAQGALADKLRRLPAQEASNELADLLRKEVASILRMPVENVPADRDLSEIGLDSLMAVEMALSIQQALGEDLAPSGLGGNTTLNEIAAMLVRHLQEEPDKLPAGSTAPALRSAAGIDDRSGGASRSPVSGGKSGATVVGRSGDGASPHRPAKAGSSRLQGCARESASPTVASACPEDVKFGTPAE